MTTQFAICGDETRSDGVNLGKHTDIKERLLSKLDFPLRDAHYVSIPSSFSGRRCQWIHQDDSWLGFSTLPCGVLCIYGSEGTGKSTILKYLCSDLKRKKTSVVHHFFGGDSDPLQRSVLGMCRTLICQLLSQDSSFRPVVDLNIDESDEMRLFSLLQEVIIQYLHLRHGPLFCFIDALDALNGDELIRTVVQSLTDISEVARKESLDFRICFSGRVDYCETLPHETPAIDLVVAGENQRQKHVESRVRHDSEDVKQKLCRFILQAGGPDYNKLGELLDANWKEYDRGGLATWSSLEAVVTKWRRDQDTVFERQDPGHRDLGG